MMSNEEDSDGLPDWPLSDSSDSDGLTSEFLIGMLQSDTKPLHTRSRAAPFFQELAPGWRARARDLAPPYARRNASRHPLTKDMADDDVSQLGFVDDTHEPRGPRRRGRSLTRSDKEDVHLDDDESPTRGSSTQRTGTFAGKSRSGNRDDFEGTPPDSASNDDDDARSPGEDPERSGETFSTRTERGNSRERTSRAGSSDTRKTDCADSGRCCLTTHGGECSDAKCFQLDTGSDSEYEAESGWPQPGPLRQRLGDERGSGEAETSKEVKPSLFRWAVNVVNGATDRSKTLVSRVLSVGSSNKDIATESEFAKCTDGRESWTQVTSSATQYDDNIMQDLKDPVWRQTFLLTTGELLESQPVKPDSPSKVNLFEPSDIKTTVWYGQLNKNPKPRLKRNLMKGIRSTAAVFLCQKLWG